MTQIKDSHLEIYSIIRINILLTICINLFSQQFTNEIAWLSKQIFFLEIFFSPQQKKMRPTMKTETHNKISGRYANFSFLLSLNIRGIKFICSIYHNLHLPSSKGFCVTIKSELVIFFSLAFFLFVIAMRAQF